MNTLCLKKEDIFKICVLILKKSLRTSQAVPSYYKAVFVFSTVIISQMPVANWYQLFGDNTYADACLSHMTSKAYRLDFPDRDRRVESK